ncbi:MAG: hypothetical protein H0U70_06870 [Tatlockia sp.]|nr:hypothetical protein [Tatlockia sp.]
MAITKCDNTEVYSGNNSLFFKRYENSNFKADIDASDWDEVSYGLNRGILIGMFSGLVVGAVIGSVVGFVLGGFPGGVGGAFFGGLAGGVIGPVLGAMIGGFITLFFELYRLGNIYLNSPQESTNELKAEEYAPHNSL